MSSRIDRAFCQLGALASGVLVGLLAYRMITRDAPQWAIPCYALSAVGLICLLAAWRGGALQSLVSAIIKLALVTGFFFGLAEAGCRLIRLDFHELLGARRANEAFPIYFRLPTHPSGEVFFVRPPGSSWTGKPLQSLLKNHRSTDSAYTDEAEITLRYSQEGFRNPDELHDWDIAVVGDSFTESGYLPESQIFTGVAAMSLGKRIKNLGITDTGNFAHAHYLEAYGKAPSCRSAVLAFFEGNDIGDNVRESSQLDVFKQTGERPSHDIPHQPSLLKALWTLVRDLKKLKVSDRSYANAWVKLGDAEVPVTIADAPPSTTSMKPEEKQALAAALDRYAAACQTHGMKSHLLYLPCKRRVYHGLLRHGEGYPEPDWQPGDLPQHLAAECAKRGIQFMDATPSLAAAALAGIGTFNPIYDTHNNAEGHRIIGEVLADALK